MTTVNSAKNTGLPARRTQDKRQRLDDLTSALIKQWEGYPETQEYIRTQWRSCVVGTNRVAVRSRNLFYLGRWVVIVGATIVPTLIAVSVQNHGTLAVSAQVLAVLLSLLVAAASGALQVTQMGQRWHIFHRYRVDLEHVAVEFFMQRGDYQVGDPAQRYGVFVDAVEKIRLLHESRYATEIVRLGRNEGASD